MWSSPCRLFRCSPSVRVKLSQGFSFFCHMCPGLHAITHFKNCTIFRRFATKNRDRSDFRSVRFFVAFFFSLTRRLFRIQQIVRKFGKIGAATMFRTLRFFATFLFSSLTKEGFRNHLVLQKVRKIVLFPHFTIFPYFFFFIS